MRGSLRTDFRCKITTVFYFTDNLVTYFAVNNGSACNWELQALLYHIEKLDHTLGCFLEVAHIPGTTIIKQGSNELSRGIWMSPDVHLGSQQPTYCWNAARCVCHRQKWHNKHCLFRLLKLWTERQSSRHLRQICSDENPTPIQSTKNQGRSQGRPARIILH